MTRRGLTYEEATKLGLGDEHPDSPKQRGTVAPSRPTVPTPDDGMNKTERAYSRRLDDLQRDGRIRRWWREPAALILAGKTRYKPDFLVELSDGRLLFVEVKGFMREDAAIKIKIAAATLPCFAFYLVYRERQSWVYRQVTRSGIGGWCPEPF
jgi:hypothetical protein